MQVVVAFGTSKCAKTGTTPPTTATQNKPFTDPSASSDEVVPVVEEAVPADLSVAEVPSEQGGQPSSADKLRAKMARQAGFSKRDMELLSGSGSSSSSVVKEISGSHNYDDKWAERNPGYLAALREREDLARTEKGIVGYTVEAGSTTTVTATQKKKHQITFLAANARVKQNEIATQLQNSHSIRKEAGTKYGW